MQRHLTVVVTILESGAVDLHMTGSHAVADLEAAAPTDKSAEMILNLADLINNYWRDIGAEKVPPKAKTN